MPYLIPHAQVYCASIYYYSVGATYPFVKPLENLIKLIMIFLLLLYINIHCDYNDEVFKEEIK